MARETRSVSDEKVSVMSANAKLGGGSPLSVFVKAGADVVDSLFSTREGGAKSTIGLRDLLLEQHDGAYEVVLTHEPPEPAPELADDLERLVTARPDVVVFSVSADLTTSPDDFYEGMSRVVKLLKGATDTRIIVYNCSSVDPNETTINYRSTPNPPSLQVHRLNHRLLELSISEGISIIDADRVVAELGGEMHVRGGLLDYSREVCEALCREFARVLADYGFFERRPLLPQLGARKEEAA
jgi:hypothetical protein